MWTERLRNATEDKVGGDDFYRYVSRRLTAAYDLEVGRERALKRHPGVSRFTLNYLEPKLRAELDRRIMASADLIKLTVHRLLTGQFSVSVAGRPVFPPSHR
ncbi:Uncharacterised protein [Salmonella enterica subsp. enterica]|uniref:Uncharacterized protein n=1 Tax=Salmonella enterica I TaxID=59201 RepID=A0A379W818_SALET|nr:Uncharacterised protein [Salmonella enterica subsp. enterica]